MNDLRYALRTLRATPAFTAVAALTLALGIGANTAIFSVVNAVLLSPLPFADPGRLVVIRETYHDRFAGVTAPDYMDWRARSRSFSGIAATRSITVNLTGTDEPERLSARRVSASYFSTLGANAALGRTFLEAEEPFGAARVAVLSDGLWRRRFAADQGVVGRTITLGAEPYTVIGVMPPGFGLSRGAVELWLPLALTPGELNAPGSHFLNVLGRLRLGVTREQAQAEMVGIAAQIARERPGSNADISVALQELRESVVSGSRRSVLVLFGAVGFVLLIACVNVANLLLARATARQREFSIRAALGATRRRLFAQLLTESVALALVGSAVGLLLAYWGTDLLVKILPPGVPRLDRVRIDGLVLTFTLVIAILTGLVFGLAPAVQASRPDLHESLKEGGRATGSARRQRLRGALVVSEVAIALVVLVGSGLLLRSFLRLRSVDPGFDPRNLLAVHLALPEARYGEPAQAVRFYQEIVGRVRALPGVHAAAVTSQLPLDESGFSISVFVPGRYVPGQRDVPLAFARSVAPGYFPTVGMQLLRGRDVSDLDRAGAPRAAVINETMARLVWPGEDPIGKTFTMDDGAPGPITVVGIARDVKHFGLETEPRSELFLPLAQTPALFWPWTERSMTLVVRTATQPGDLVGSVREAVGAVDKDIPLYRVTTMENILNESIATQRAYMLLLGVFAAVALALATVGIYGVMAYTVSQRVHEIGIRIALGARTEDVAQLVVRQGLRLAALGVALGTVGAVMVTRVLRSLLFSVTATDPPTFAIVAVLLVAVAVLASYVPARRAGRVDPMVALRSE